MEDHDVDKTKANEEDRKVKAEVEIIEEPLNPYDERMILQNEDIKSVIEGRKKYSEIADAKELRDIEGHESYMRCNVDQTRHRKVYEAQYERAVVSSESQADSWRAIAASLDVIAAKMG